MILSIPDMADWSILDFELALEGVQQINAASLCIQNQPRSYNHAARDYHPGGSFIASVGEEWCSTMLVTIIDTLQARRFPDPQEEDRRLRLLLHYHTQWGPAGEPLPNIIAMLERWRQPIAA